MKIPQDWWVELGFSDDFDVVDVKLIKKGESEGNASDVNPDEDEKFIWDDQPTTPKVIWKLRMKTGVVIGILGLMITAYRAFGGG